MIWRRLDNLRQGPGTALVALEWGPPSGVVVLHWYQALEAALPVAQFTLLLVSIDDRRRGTFAHESHETL